MRNAIRLGSAPVCAAVMSGLISACAVGPNYHRPTTPVASSFANAHESGFSDAEVTAKFWTLFGDPTLNRLVDEGLAQNKDLARARANLRASRAAARLTGFDAYPTITAAGSYSHALASQHQLAAIPNAPRSVRETDTVEAGFDALWELDFFGRVRREIQAARADMRAAEAGVRDAQVTVSAEVARNYFVLRGLQEQLEVATRNADNQSKTLSITQVRLEAGRGSELDTSRARAQLKTTLASIPPLQSSIATTIYRLSVLTGRLPDALTQELSKPQAAPALPSLNAIGSPEALLRRRPDIRVAEQNLAASTARVGVAVADLFPRVTFVGSVGYDAGSFRGIGKAGSDTFSVGPSISWAAFDLGRVGARIGIARAEKDAALAAYESTVLSALEETEGALINYGRSQSRRDTLGEAAEASSKAARLARQRFEGGLTDFLNVLEAERDALTAQDALAQSRTQTATALVAVYKALGGGWLDEPLQ
jgi:multidrug efflux system outer membrane protein